MQRKLHFVPFDPDPSAEAARARISGIRSHARRDPHARARYARIMAYQAEVSKSPSSEAEPPREETVGPRTRNPTWELHVPRQCDLRPVVLSPVVMSSPVVPSPVTLLGAGRVDPFQTLVKEANRVERLLLDYYLTYLVPIPTPTCMRSLQPDGYHRGVKTQLVPLAFTDVTVLCGLYLQACRGISARATDEDAKFYSTLALNYKGVVIRGMNEKISKEYASPSDMAIASAIFLASDELNAGDLAIGKSHVEAIEQMVAIRGGIDMLGLGGFLAHLVLSARTHLDTAVEQSLATAHERQYKS